MKVHRITIPQNYNDGTAIPTAMIESYLTRALEAFGGYTFNPMPVIGAWRDDNGQDCIEKVYVLEIATDDMAALKSMVKDMQKDFMQEAMYVQRIGSVEFM